MQMQDKFDMQTRSRLTARDDELTPLHKNRDALEHYNHFDKTEPHKSRNIMPIPVSQSVEMMPYPQILGSVPVSATHEGPMMINQLMKCIQ